MDYFLKNKIKHFLFLSTIGILTPIAFIACKTQQQKEEELLKDALFETLKGIGNIGKGFQGATKSPSDNQKKFQAPSFENENSDKITFSLLGLEGWKKNPKKPANIFDSSKNYTTSIDDSILDSTSNKKYGLRQYWNYYMSLPQMMQNLSYSEYYEKVKYLQDKLLKYGEKNDFSYPRTFINMRDDIYKEAKKVELNIGSRFKNITDDFQKNSIVADYMASTGYINGDQLNEIPPFKDSNKKSELDYFFRDEYYQKINYRPTEQEKEWYQTRLINQNRQRILSGQHRAYELISALVSFELKILEDSTKGQKEADIKEDFRWGFGGLWNLLNMYEDFFKPDKHLSLRKDLVFNISENIDMQSFSSDIIKVYNDKIAPLISAGNSNKKISTPLYTNLSNRLKNDDFMNKYIYPLVNSTIIWEDGNVDYLNQKFNMIIKEYHQLNVVEQKAKKQKQEQKQQKKEKQEKQEKEEKVYGSFCASCDSN